MGALSVMVLLAATATLSAPAPLAELMSKLSGPQARECGIIGVGQPAAEAFRCAREALKAGHPYRLAVQVQGVDSILWRSATLEPDGTSWLLYYDSDIHGGGGIGKESLTPLPCHEIRFSDTDERRIWCGLKGDAQ